MFRGRPYTLQIPSGNRVYTPWFDEGSGSEFVEILREVRAAGPLTVSPDRCYILYQFCKRSLALRGHVAECGVFTGGTAHLLSEVVERTASKTPLHLFDTFTGMPETRPPRDYHSAGHFGDTSLKQVERRLARYPFCQYHPGLIPDTFGEVSDVAAFSFAHVDVDIHASTLACLAWFWPRLVPGGAIVVDDYGFYPYRHAARLAVDEFFAGGKEEPIVLPTGQALILRR